jgi:hypothetical protein
MLACFWLGLLATGLVLLARLWPAPPPQLSNGDSGISANFPARIKSASASCRREPCVAGITNLHIASLQVNRGSPRAAECLEWVYSVEKLLNVQPLLRSHGEARRETVAA